MWISPALAQAGGAAVEPGLLEAFLPIVLIFVVFYFLLIRPQQKKMKQHKEMLSAIKRGDRIVTGGGIVGQVTKVIDDTEVQVEIAEGVRVRVYRAMVAQVLAKTQPVGEARTESRGGGGRKPTTAAEAEDAEPADESDASVEPAPVAEAEKPKGATSMLKKLLGGRNN